MTFDIKKKYLEIISDYIKTDKSLEDVGLYLNYIDYDIPFNYENFDIAKGLYASFKRNIGTDNTKVYIHSIMMQMLIETLPESLNYYHNYISKFANEISNDLSILIELKDVKKIEKITEKNAIETKVKKFQTKIDCKFFMDSYSYLESLHNLRLLEIANNYNFNLKNLAKVVLEKNGIEETEILINECISNSIFIEYVESDKIEDIFIADCKINEKKFYFSMNHVIKNNPDLFDKYRNIIEFKNLEKEIMCEEIFKKSLKYMNHGIIIDNKNIKFTNLDYDFLFRISPKEVANSIMKNHDKETINKFRSYFDLKKTNQKIGLNEAGRMGYSINGIHSTTDDIVETFNFMEENSIEPLNYNYKILVERKINNIPFLPFMEEGKVLKRNNNEK